MSHYVYRTARGLLRTAHADSPIIAWRLASKRYKPTVMHDLQGAAWVQSTSWRCAREPNADVEPIWAQSFYFDACAVELSPAAITMLRDITMGRESTYSCRGRSAHGGAVNTQASLLDRGLVTSMLADATLTDLGRAFVKLVGGAS